ncbi:MAG TPA: restriction endonuclease [Frankiaceae bacterium]|nr:restriction endonuclease [Frankiaceae bacterium]
MATELVVAGEFALLFLRACYDGEPGCRSAKETDTDDLVSWVAQVERAVRRTKQRATYGRRRQPNWMHFRSDDGVSVFRSESLAGAFGAIARSREGELFLADASGVFRRTTDGCIRTFVPARTIRAAVRALTALEGKPPVGAAPTLIALENGVAVIGGEHTVFLPAECGRRAYDVALDAIRQRRDAENELLMADRAVRWAPHVPGDVFERLVMALLMREDGVSWVAPVGASSERDGGRDLLVEWTTPILPTERADESHPPTRRRRLIVQIKSDAAPVGVSRVTAIYDTIRHHEMNGYFLVVRSRLTAPLVDRLYKIRADGEYYAGWWDRSDLDARLRRNPDLVEEFGAVVSFAAESDTS